MSDTEHGTHSIAGWVDHQIEKLLTNARSKNSPDQQYCLVNRDF
jgi:hypothetical protein